MLSISTKIERIDNNVMQVFICARTTKDKLGGDVHTFFYFDIDK
jgi:hypothetical protein